MAGSGESNCCFELAEDCSFNGLFSGLGLFEVDEVGFKFAGGDAGSICGPEVVKELEAVGVSTGNASISVIMSL